MNTKKKYGWLIANHFLQTDKFNEIYKWLLVSAEKFDCELKLLTNAELLSFISGEQLTVLTSSTLSAKSVFSDQRPDFVLFWDKDIRLAHTLEQLGFRLFNRADAIAACDDKSLTFMRLSVLNHTLSLDKESSPLFPMPRTVLAPMTYENIGYRKDVSFLNQIELQLSYPMILKECFGSFGAQVYLVQNRAEAEQVITQCAGRPLLFQQFINSSYGRDLRLQVVGGQVVATMLRTHDTDFRANITNGGKMSPYVPSPKACTLAIRVCEALQLDFAGVDLLFGEHDEPILCEVNSNAHFKNIHTCTGVNVADKIMEHIIKEIYQEEA